ncbi:MAG: ATP-binding protein [Anaerolineae bacterium]
MVIEAIERWITGILRMRQLMRQHALPEPVFQEIGQTFRVTFLGSGDNILGLIPESGVTDLRTLCLNERQVHALSLMVNEGQELANQQQLQVLQADHRRSGLCQGVVRLVVRALSGTS